MWWRSVLKNMIYVVHDVFLGGRWTVGGDDNGDNTDNFAGATYNGADIRTGKAVVGAQGVGYKYCIKSK